MIPTHFDRAQNLKHPDTETNRPRSDVWLALGVILAVLLAVLIALWTLGDQSAATTALGFW